MIIPDYDNTPEEILSKCNRGEIAPEGAISVLKIRRNYYEYVSRGGAADSIYPITPEEASEKIGAVKTAIETLQLILHPPEFPIDLTETRNKLREIRDRCITGMYTREKALALFDQTWIDFEKDTIRRTDIEALQLKLRQILVGCRNIDVINEIKMEIENLPPPPTSPVVGTEPAPDVAEPDTDLSEALKKKSYISKDRITLVSLDNIVNFIADDYFKRQLPITEKFLKNLGLKKQDGKEYSTSALRKAIETANAK
jgi:hypothetical protein